MKRILPVLVILALLVLPSTAYADIAPPAQPPGANPGPGNEITQVRMVTETVLIDVQASAPANSLGLARVTADFTMRNLGTESETMAARFPISASDGWSSYPEIRDLQIQVDGKIVRTRRISGEDPYYYGSNQVPWAEFDVTFPPGQDVNVRVKCTVEGAGEYPYISFNYILSTGAGWKDTIGSADLIVRLPYEANTQNVILDTHTGWSETTPGGVFSGNEIRWHYDNLEPTREDNFEVSLVMPSAWKKVLTERETVSKSPNDGEAWGRLGKVYKEVTFLRKGFRQDAGGRELYDLSVQAYEKAVTLLPDDALWHAGFADLLAFHALYATYEGLDTTAEFIRAMKEIHEALALRPNDPKVLEIAEQFYWFFPAGAVERIDNTYDFLWLTATPTPLVIVTDTPTLPPSEPVSSTATLVPTPQPAAPTPTESQPGKSLPICGTALLVPLAAVLFRKRMR